MTWLPAAAVALKSTTHNQYPMHYYQNSLQEFTWYPVELQSKFQRLRAPWTYMTAKERNTGPFLRPKRWFPKAQYKKVVKLCVFGLTTSNRKSLQFVVPKPRTAEQWAVDVKNKLVPFIKKCFPNRTSYNILFDGEALLHADASKAAYRAGHITVAQGWPGYSPELNPQENVWAWAEDELRRMETGKEPLAAWSKKVIKAVDKYPAKGKLVGSMAKRCQEIIDRSGGALDR